MKRSKNMSIADEQKHMAHTLAMIGFGKPWSVNDEIKHGQQWGRKRKVPCIPSRNKREGYFWGKENGKAGMRTKNHYRHLVSVTLLDNSRKQHKLTAIRRKNFMKKFIARTS